MYQLWPKDVLIFENKSLSTWETLFMHERMYTRTASKDQFWREFVMNRVLLRFIPLILIFCEAIQSFHAHGNVIFAADFQERNQTVFNFIWDHDSNLACDWLKSFSGMIIVVVIKHTYNSNHKDNIDNNKKKTINSIRSTRTERQEDRIICRSNNNQSYSNKNYLTI